MISINTKLIAMSMLVLISSALAQEQALNPYAEQVSGGKLSAHLEKKIIHTLHSLGIKTIPPLRNTSEKLLESEPKGRCNIFVKFNCYYIDESFFSTLSDEELRASWAYAFYGAEALQKRATQKSRISNTVTLSQIMLAGASFKYISSQFPQLSLWRKAGLSALATLPLELVEYLLLKYKTKHDIYYIDNYIAVKAGSKEGLIGLLKKMILVSPENYDTEIMHKRIAHLEKDKKAI